MEFLKIILLFCVLIIQLHEMVARPSKNNNIFGRSDNLSRCENDPKIDIDCQKCAKITKSNVVYPMCCTEKDDAYRWCLSYMHFGLHKRSGNTEYSWNQVKTHWLYKKVNQKNYLEEDDALDALSKDQMLTDNEV